MSLYSKQQIFCNACGKEMFVEMSNVIGRNYKVCSLRCNQEIEYRGVLSMLGKEYYPNPTSNEMKVLNTLLAECSNIPKPSIYPTLGNGANGGVQAEWTVADRWSIEAVIILGSETIHLLAVSLKDNDTQNDTELSVSVDVPENVRNAALWIGSYFADIGEAK